MVGLRKGVVWAVVLGLTAVSLMALAQTTARTVRGTTQTMEFFPEGNNKNPVTLSFLGQIYTTPLRVLDVTQANWDRSTPESSYRGMLSAAKAGDLDWILESFASGDRERVKQIMAEPDARQRHHDFHKKVVRSEISLRVDYGEYAILIVTERQDTGVKITSEVAMKKTARGWLGTNDLKSDTFFVVILEAIKARM